MKDKKEYVTEIPATEGGRDALMNSRVEISGDIVAELNIQVSGYVSVGCDYSSAIAKSIKALEKYGSDKVTCIPLTQEMINVKDYGFRLL
jgi:hypothetical protein